MNVDVIEIEDITVKMITDEHSGKCSCGCGAGQVIRVTAKQGTRSFARAKTFKGETAWSDANRYANDILFKAQHATGVRADRLFH